MNKHIVCVWHCLSNLQDAIILWVAPVFEHTPFVDGRYEFQFSAISGLHLDLPQYPSHTILHSLYIYMYIKIWKRIPQESCSARVSSTWMHSNSLSLNWAISISSGRKFSLKDPFIEASWLSDSASVITASWIYPRRPTSRPCLLRDLLEALSARFLLALPSTRGEETLSILFWVDWLPSDRDVSPLWRFLCIRDTGEGAGDFKPASLDSKDNLFIASAWWEAWRCRLEFLLEPKSFRLATFSDLRRSSSCNNASRFSCKLSVSVKSSLRSSAEFENRSPRK